MKTVEIRDLPKADVLTKEEAALLSGGYYAPYRVVAGMYWGPIPYNKDPETGGEMTRAWLRSLRRGRRLF